MYSNSSAETYQAPFSAIANIANITKAVFTALFKFIALIVKVIIVIIKLPFILLGALTRLTPAEEAKFNHINRFQSGNFPPY